MLNAQDALISPLRLETSSRRIRISTTLDQRELRISVWDNGEGIPKANLQRIFAPFFSTKPDTGTGLGLGMVTKYLSLYKGTLAVESEEGVSTTFTVILPTTALVGAGKGEEHGYQ
ncbi:MAG: ATP-binding protein [Myxococcota bacterium]|nr:ATP-binding protein [Myxococcota bacterium]